jgi:TIR domain
MEGSMSATGSTSSAGGQIFLCYSNIDGRDYAHRLAQALWVKGIRVWLDDRPDSEDPGDDGSLRQIDASAAVVVVITPQAAKSTRMRLLISHAGRMHRSVLPLALAGNGLAELADVPAADVSQGRLPDDIFLDRLGELAARPVAKARGAARGRAPWSRKTKLIAVGVATGSLLLLVACGGVIYLAWSAVRAVTTQSSPRYEVGQCVKREGESAVAANCRDTNAYRITSIRDMSQSCENNDMPHVEWDQHIYCLEPAS